MSNTDDIHNLSTQGERFSTEFSFTWIDPGPIEAGEVIAPAKLTSEAARIFAALHLILGDLAFAEECLKAAYDIGIPDDNRLQSKALIFSGVVGYARCFKSGVRALTLTTADLKSKGAPFDFEIHEYLIAMRDKHVAHSVNDFEQCESIAIMIRTPGAGWQDGSGIGVIKKQSIGISRAFLHRAVSHVIALRQFLEADLPAQRKALQAEFHANLERTGKWDMAPGMKISDHSTVAERR